MEENNQQYLLELIREVLLEEVIVDIEPFVDVAEEKAIINKWENRDKELISTNNKYSTEEYSIKCLEMDKTILNLIKIVKNSF